MNESPTPQFSVHRAFVVQFSASGESEAEVWQGRVEHITSGKRTRFASLAELVKFVEQIIRAPPRKSNKE